METTRCLYQDNHHLLLAYLREEGCEFDTASHFISRLTRKMMAGYKIPRSGRNGELAKIGEILVSSKLPAHFSTAGFGDFRSHQLNTTGITFFSELGRRLTDVSGDPRETTYLFQRVSLAVQRYNSVAFIEAPSGAPSRSPLNWTSATPVLCF